MIPSHLPLSEKIALAVLAAVLGVVVVHYTSEYLDARRRQMTISA